MGVIKKRTVFYDDSDGYVRFHDFARVETELGTGVEIFHTIGQREGDNLDWTEDCQRIDEMKNLSLDRPYDYIVDPSGTPLHGGVCNGRNGR